MGGEEGCVGVIMGLITNILGCDSVRSTRGTWRTNIERVPADDGLS